MTLKWLRIFNTRQISLRLSTSLSDASVILPSFHSMNRRPFINHLHLLALIVAEVEDRVVRRRYRKDIVEDAQHHHAGLVWTNLHARTLDVRSFHGSTISSAVQLYNPAVPQRKVYLYQGQHGRFVVGLFRSDVHSYPVGYLEHYEHWYGFTNATHLSTRKLTNLIYKFLVKEQYPSWAPLDLASDAGGRLMLSLKSQYLDLSQPFPAEINLESPLRSVVERETGTQSSQTQGERHEQGTE